ncbi:hypothetical protein RAMDARK_1703 [Rickettsia amblyommatis str. Darkwater]|nr:hypothetical protein RAMDARK_0936 [Rickettsia amblyommatis str. Darkwater]KJV99997.1 hypothetical protein RAMDARK_1703 [Rickettsia amblyommatis str. Darkwater]
MLVKSLLKYHRIKIGVFPYLSITDARVKASELKVQIAKGDNPVEEKVRLSKEPNFKEFYERYLK